MKSKTRPAQSCRLHRLQLAAVAALMSMAVVSPTMAAEDSGFDLDKYVRPGTLYAAASIGLLNTGFDCKDPSGNSYFSCSRPLIGGKVFGGYRMTPSLATEVSFYYLGGSEVATAGAASPVTENYRKSATRAMAIGIDWTNELFQVMNQHIRFGIARVYSTNKLGYTNGTSGVQKDNVIAPYVGLGMSYLFNDHVRFYSSFDLLHTKTEGNIQVFSLGLGIEN